MTKQALILSTQTTPQAVLHPDQIACPMLTLERLPVPTGLQADALIITSRHAPALLESYSHLPSWCVGEATATVAQQAGLSVAGVGSADVAALAQQLPRDKRYLHCGADILATHTNAHFQTQGLNVQTVPVYRMTPLTELNQNIIAALEEKHVDTVLFLSSRAGHVWTQLVTQHGLGRTLSTVKALCLSTDVILSVDKLQWKDVQAAEKPRITSLQEII